MFKQNQILKIKKAKDFLNNTNYNIYLNAVENKTTKVFLTNLMQKYITIKCPITTNSNFFKYDGWYWYDWMFEGIEKEGYFLDIE